MLPLLMTTPLPQHLSLLMLHQTSHGDTKSLGFSDSKIYTSLLWPSLAKGEIIWYGRHILTNSSSLL